jgi:hypothetical protein
MSADACIAFYGLRFEIQAAEIESLEDRTDSRMQAARKAGLKYYWGNFGDPDARYLLFVGAQLAKVGPENSWELSISSRDLLAMMESTKANLEAAGLSGEPSFYFQWQPDA